MSAPAVAGGEVFKMTDEEERGLVAQYSTGKLGSHELERRLGLADYGDVITLLAKYDLPFPQAPTTGRESQLAVLRAAIVQAPHAR